MSDAVQEPAQAVKQSRARLLLVEIRRFVLIFLAASFFLFLALESMPEDPVSLRVKNPDPERIAEIRDSLGLNDPWLTRYVRGVGDFLTLDWGESLISGRPVAGEVARYLPATLELAVLGILFGVSFGLALVLSAHATGWTWLLQPVRGMGALGLTVPIFWIGILFVLVFSVQLGWLPVGGRFDFAYEAPRITGFLLLDSLLVWDLHAFWIACRHLVLPVLTLGLYPAAVVAGTLEARLGESFLERLVTALKSRGFSPARVWGRHVLRLVSGPVVTVIGTQAGALLGGAVLTETVYSWPGMGRFLVDGVLNRDLFVIQHGLLLVVVLALCIVTVSDLIATRLDHQLQNREDS
ncbi:ABC transporter permease [Puniceicoccales bacterium CK1056]|uniref:ABC transporter permease n=1 Tax=Oceanipulchritudo coccoides TaxID=2706888 RepID=A0A6B2LZ72_9BACT|nr:ABC transporter permease [Oceanipulchritudo coccoides]NDV60830.1 ABC transporter permease [Oceanipulchritudo coccoides]